MQQHQGIRRIVVGVDGSDHSAAALGWAIRMARGMGSEVIAVFAILPPITFDPGYGTPVVPVEYDEQWRSDMKKNFETVWCKPLIDAGINYRTVFEDGRPASVITAAAEADDADVVLVGRRGRGGIAELLLGSVSHELVLHCKRPVLVISGVHR